MDLEEIIKSSDLFESKKLKIKINSTNKFRTYNQIETIFKLYLCDDEIFSFLGDYASTTIGVIFDKNYKEICKICEIHNSLYFKFPNVSSKSIFKYVISNSYPSYLN